MHADVYAVFGAAGIDELQSYVKKEYRFGKYGDVVNKDLFDGLRNIITVRLKSNSQCPRSVKLVLISFSCFLFRM